MSRLALLVLFALVPALQEAVTIESLPTVGSADAAPVASDPADDAGADQPVFQAELDAMRTELRSLRFESAVELATRLIDDPEVPVADRVEALRVRLAAAISLGRTDAVERDLRTVVTLDPGFEPDPATTPERTLARFRTIRDATVGRLRLVLDPPGATVVIDGRETATDGPVPLVAGDHTITVRHEGFESSEQIVEIGAGKEFELSIELTQIARTVVIETVDADVEVRLDGRDVGRTVSSDGPSSLARLEVPWLALGEYRVELRKPCHRAEQLKLLLRIDLLDRGPVRLGPVDLLEVRSTVHLAGGPDGARVELGGEIVGPLPLERLELCPGAHELVVRTGDRIAWSDTLDIGEAETRTVRVDPRPNLVTLGDASASAAGLAVAGGFNERARPRDRIDGRGPAALELARDVDLVLARDGSGWIVYSPHLQLSAPLESSPQVRSRPEWRAASWGLGLVDSRIGGPARVVHVVGGAAADRAGIRVGDRLVELGGVKVGAAGEARAVMRLASVRAALPVSWERPRDGRDGVATMRGELRATESPLLPPPPRERLDAMLRAAWAAVDGDCAPDRAADATANLALLMSHARRPEAAVRAWRRVSWPDRAGIGAGTVAFYLGRDLESLAAQAGADRPTRLREAASAYRRAAASSATAVDDDGPLLAPAARARLAALGAVSR